jgi:hypothetical protein
VSVESSSWTQQISVTGVNASQKTRSTKAKADALRLTSLTPSLIFNHHTFTPQFTSNLNTHHVQQRIHLRPWPRSIRLQARPIYIGRRNHQRHCRGSPQAEDDEPTPKRTETLLTVATLVMKTHAPDVDVMGDPTAEFLEDGFDALQRICPDEERIWLEEAKQQADLPHVPQEMR